jgi:hypothetical protein
MPSIAMSSTKGSTGDERYDTEARSGVVRRRGLGRREARVVLAGVREAVRRALRPLRAAARLALRARAPQPFARQAPQGAPVFTIPVHPTRSH